MNDLYSRTMLLVLRMLSRIGGAARRLRTGDDRGDVPGWVLVTLMTAGLVSALWAVAGKQLEDLLTHALTTVTGP
jgi:hypothetical protein